MICHALVVIQFEFSVWGQPDILSGKPKCRPDRPKGEPESRVAWHGFCLWLWTPDRRSAPSGATLQEVLAGVRKCHDSSWSVVAAARGRAASLDTALRAYSG